MNYKSILFWLFIFGILFVFLQTFSEFHFYCLEQNQLFQFTGSYISEKLAMPGGLALVLSEFLVQFFALPYMGAAITAALLTGIGACMEGIVKQIAPKMDAFALSLLPVIALLFVHFDFNYRLQGTIAYTMVLVALLLSRQIQNDIRRLITNLVLTGVLLWFIGPAAGLFALSVVVCELCNRTPHRYWSLLTCLEVFLFGIGSVYYSMAGEYSQVFLPDGYYHMRLTPNNVIYYSWICLLLILIVVYLLRNRKALSGKTRIAGNATQALLIGLLCWWGIPTYGDAKSATVKEFDYYVGTEQWDAILEKSKGPLSNYLNMCYLNMALAHKGELTQRMFDYDQRGAEGLVVKWNKAANISTLLSDVYFTMGNISNAQEMAFESYISSMGAGNPRMLKRLVQTNLIYGSYPVAEKYLNILESTYYYADWAKAHRPFLYNDTLIEKDAVLGPLRACLPDSNYLVQTDGLDMDLQRIAEKNPSYKASIEYLGACYLLTKDLDRFKRMLEKYYGTDLLPSLPVCYQEAIITLSEKESDYWKRFNVSQSVVDRFSEYKRQVLSNKNSSALPGLMNRTYGNTYWFYYMFK